MNRENTENSNYSIRRVHYGVCHVCNTPIDMTEEESNARQSELNRIRTELFDAPVFGAKRIVALPAFKCGHSYRVDCDCYQRSDGKFCYL